IHRFPLFEEFQRFFYGEVEDVIDILSVVFNFQDFGLEAFSMACFALEEDIGHKLHLDFDLTFTLASFASPTFHVERKVGGLVAPLNRKGLVSIKLAYNVVCLYITDGIGSGRFSDRVLIYKLHLRDTVYVAREGIDWKSEE